MSPEEIEIRRRAKSHNERLKLAATFLNNMTLALLTAAIVTPIISRAEPKLDWMLLAAACQLAAHALLKWGLESED